jgi:putative spermidine/putrescine transport system substrate-binding protein
MKRNLFTIVFACVLLAAGSAWAETTITVSSYGGTYNKAIEEVFAKPFTEATGIKVNLTTFPNYARMAAQVESGNIEWDIMECESRMYTRGVKAGLFEPLDLSMIKVEDFVEGSVTKYGVGIIYYSYNIVYNTDVFPAGKGPKSMKDVWDVKKFPGARIMNRKAVSSLEAALLADGVPRNKIYPIDVDRALKKMTEIKPHVRAWFKGGGHVQQIMRQKEADLGVGMAGRIIVVAKQGAPLAWEWNDQIVVLDTWNILKGSRNKEAAMKFIAFASDPQRQAAFAGKTFYGPANKKAYDFIDKETAVLLPTYPENLAKGIILDGSWYEKHEAEVEKLWDAWKMQ